MADEDLSPQGDEALSDAPPIEEQSQDDPHAELASEMGWKPKDQWQGDPEQWKDAKSYILAGRDIQHTLSRELRGVRDEVQRLSSTSAQIMQDRLAERDAEWQQRFDKAVEDGDTEAARKLADRRPTGSQATGGPDVQTRAWIADNPWFETHPRAKALAAEISVKLAQQGYDTATQLKEAEAEVRERYPDLFKAAAKPPPATQTGQSRNPNPSNRAKGFADMPAESQKMALDLQARLGVPKEKTALSYWAQEGVKR